MADFGRVLAVVTHNVGDQALGTQVADTLTLQLDESSEFPSEGGTISTDLGLLDYTSVDVDSDTLTLADHLPGDLPDESRVELWDSDRGAVVTVTIAYITLEGSEDDGDPFEAAVRQSLRAYLPDGIRSGPGEIVEVDTDSEQVIDVPGRTPQLDGQAVWNPHSRRTFNGQVVSDNAAEKLVGWADEETDGVSFSSGRWTIVIPAWYEMSAALTWAPNATGRRRVRIVVNGVVVAIGVQPADPDIETYVDKDHQMRLSEGDYVEVWAYQHSGANLSVTDGTFVINRASS